MKKIIFVFIAFFLITPMMAQQQEGKSLGNFVKISKKGQVFTFKTTNGTAQVSLFSPTIFKISLWEKNYRDLPSYAVVAKPEKVKFTFRENKNDFILKTDSLELKITKSPVRFTFKTPEGKVINQDDNMGTYWLDGKLFCFKKLYHDEKFIGLGEKTGNLNRRGSAYTNWNTDNPNYENWSDPLYSTIPFYMGIHNGLNYGIFVDNTTKSVFNFGAGNNRFSYFSVDDGQVSYYFIYDQHVSEILKDYTHLTGRIKMPPIWGLGFQQCRWAYYPDKEVMEVAKTFRDKNIPLDVIYLDIKYMDAYKVFTWSPKGFPHPAQLVGNLKKMGIHTVVIIDPGIKVEKGYNVYDEGVKDNYFIKYPDGTNYTGQVWPGWCNFPDFTKPDVRTWWGTQFKGLVEDGVSGFWNDMNEIATWGKDVPPIIQMDWEGKHVSYLTGKNVYGMQMARATYEGTRKLMDGKRPLVLTRAGYAGLQRYTAIWTGDNHATDDHMMLGIRLINSFGLSGVPFAGDDVGGFQGNAAPDLYARWVSIGTFCPFFRVHSTLNSDRSEPWSYGESTQAVAKHFIDLRYHLLPYIYSAFYEASQTGMPVQRSLSIDYTKDSTVYNPKFDNQYLFGPSLLVVPAKSTQEAVKAYLPKGEWYSFYTDQKFNGNTQFLTSSPLERLPVFVKAGAIIPVQKLIQNTGENPGDTLEIHVYANSGNSDFVYYEDDGTSFNYENGVFFKRQINYEGNSRKIILDAPEGTFSSKFKVLRFVFHGFGDSVKKIFVNGTGETPNINSKSLYLANYQNADGGVLSFTCPNSNQKIVLNW